MDPSRFHGGAYDASNWVRVERTKGFARHNGAYTDPHQVPTVASDAHANVAAQHDLHAPCRRRARLLGVSTTTGTNPAPECAGLRNRRRHLNSTLACTPWRYTTIETESPDR